MGEKIHWMTEGYERGSLRPDDASYVTNLEAVVVGSSKSDIEEDPVVQQARESGHPVEIALCQLPDGRPYYSVRIEFPDSSDDLVQHVNPVANEFFEAIGWAPFY